MFLRTSLVALMALFGESSAEWLSPEYTWFFQFPLPIPPVKQPKFSVVNPVTKKLIDYYELEVTPFTQRIYPDRGLTSLIGYDGMSPGPTFIGTRGRETVVRMVNKGVTPSAMHLHGSYTRSPWDGWADDTILPGQYKDYYYPNSQNGRFLWYHDHAVDTTAVNDYFGQSGAWIIRDPADDSLGLPREYGVNDIPLIISSKQYNEDGSLFSPAGETEGLLGDVIHVNGQPWPFLAVEPRKYRLRFLNAAISRAFVLSFKRQDQEEYEPIPFQVIASDSGLLTNPVTSPFLAAAMAERWEVIFDFTPFAGQKIDLVTAQEPSESREKHKGKGREYLEPVMRFVVSPTPVVDTTVIPAALRNVPFPPPLGDIVDRRFNFHREDDLWKINDVVFNDAQNRILANVPRGTVEVWEIENGGGGSFHPVHVHMVDFRIIGRYSNSKWGSDRDVLPYEAAGLKDVVWLGEDEIVRVEAHYAPWDGIYMFHCHNLIHEDHQMMAAFDVTNLKDLGYNETAFNDPMEGRWRAVPVNKADFTKEAITKKITFMASLQPYNNLDVVTQKLDQYWAARGGLHQNRPDFDQDSAKKNGAKKKSSGVKMRRVTRAEFAADE
ncbi:bilirubin oxidase [Colletotrichum karsti]|uniref:Bilirubin oxidase n=1 Tax=Colletotrichum karsti TaxID=1095194 RepID=A0A9P6IF09_9PEZI|nr:bilirubin oxidase [Colletotrichum karsti]KAF9881525.1 bilirubin oxidase [Colletotrichum karsti]